MRTCNTFFLSVAITLFLASCSKSGDQGPVGPAGPQGGTGQQGPAGSANVKIDTFTVATTQWTYGAIYYVGSSPNVSTGYVSKYFDHAMPRLTADFLQNDLTLVYFQSEPGVNVNNYTHVPFAFPTGLGYALNLASETFVGKTRVHFFLSKISADPPLLTTYSVSNYKFKVITIDGSIARSAEPLPDVNDYAAVCKYYGISE
ncbi:MAG TPA: hypothetical protein VK644_05575 [Chitinophagaceae bacterium]|nr:hypothetical protein [Chitinophagaceae bacterium]